MPSSVLGVINLRPHVKITVRFENHEELLEDEEYAVFLKRVQSTTDGLANVFAAVLAFPDQLFELFQTFLKTFGSMVDEEIQGRKAVESDEQDDGI